MIWLICIISLLLLVTGWLLLSPFVLEVDTRIPQAGLRWASIGNVRLWYDEEWQMGIRVLFFKKTIRLSEIKSKPFAAKNKRAAKRKRKQMKAGRALAKAVRMIRTFRVTEWQLAVDTGDYTRTAKLYPLNFLPYLFQHLYFNFRDENYLVLKVRNRPWRLLYAFMR